uniref:Probable lysosomal cobalamin transporter,related n=1 Tax=Neospora caninum (strain Liverpool) TaxID=572307 RepID=A0A0F7UMI3_NEOCL|nr:TPA: Probable lysosomal cobalamin transporter,related [Neospora caninum Liverpool]
MSLLLGGWVYAAAAGALLLLSGSIYWYYVRRKASNPVAFLAFSATLTAALLLCLLVPLDILVVSRLPEGALAAGAFPDALATPAAFASPFNSRGLTFMDMPAETKAAGAEKDLDTKGGRRLSAVDIRGNSVASPASDPLIPQNTPPASLSSPSLSRSPFPEGLRDRLSDFSDPPHGSAARRLAAEEPLPSPSAPSPSSPSSPQSSPSSPSSSSSFSLSARPHKDVEAGAARLPSFSFSDQAGPFGFETPPQIDFSGAALLHRLQSGAVTVELPPLALDALSLKQLYVSLFSLLLFLTYAAVPFAFFYSRQLQSLKAEFGRGRSYDVDTPVVPPFTVACAAAQRTLIFVVLLLLFLSLCLTQRPSFRQPSSPPSTHAGDKAGVEAAAASVDYVLRYTAALFDLDHSGADSLLFVVSALLAFGQLGWVLAGAYGMAALPVLWLRGRMTPQQQQREVQREVAEIREQQRQLQSKYVNAGDGASLTAMSEKDRAKLLELRTQQQQFTERTYRLQEEEQQQSGCLAFLYRGVLLPFRWTFGVVFFVLSLVAAGALFLALFQRLEFSRCTYSCGFVLDDDATAQRDSVFFNPLDELLVHLSQFFPADFLLVGVYIALLFLCLLYGIFSLRLRICTKTCEPVRRGRTPPESLLILCFLLVHFLLAASLALLSMAPRYASFGAQTFSPSNGSDPIPCSLQATATGEETSCRMSFFAAVFSRAAIAYPSFANFFFFSNWVFLGIYALCVLHCLLTRRKQPYLSDRWLEADESADESLGVEASRAFALSGAQDSLRVLGRRGAKEEETLKLLATCDEACV